MASTGGIWPKPVVSVSVIGQGCCMLPPPPERSSALRATNLATHCEGQLLGQVGSDPQIVGEYIL